MPKCFNCVYVELFQTCSVREQVRKRRLMFRALYKDSLLCAHLFVLHYRYRN
jgi:hypothetical protein